MDDQQPERDDAGDPQDDSTNSPDSATPPVPTDRHNTTIRDVLAASEHYSSQFEQLSKSISAASFVADNSWKKTVLPMLAAMSETMKTKPLTPSVLEAMKVPAISSAIREQQKILDSFSRDVIRSMPQMPRVDAAKILGMTPARVSQLAKVESGRSFAKDLLDKMEEDNKLRKRLAAQPVSEFLEEATPMASENEGVVERLERLATLYREGLLTGEEFTQAKRRLLDD